MILNGFIGIPMVTRQDSQPGPGQSAEAENGTVDHVLRCTRDVVGMALDGTGWHWYGWSVWKNMKKKTR